jgi:hypothetical protein
VLNAVRVELAESDLVAVVHSRRGSRNVEARKVSRSCYSCGADLRSHCHRCEVLDRTCESRQLRADGARIL